MARTTTLRPAKPRRKKRAGARAAVTKSRSRPSPSMTYIEDRGSFYDAPIETVWDFMQKDEEFHPKAHKPTLRNMQDQRLSDVTSLLRYEVRDGGRWKKYVSRLTEIRPAVRVLEVLEGPTAGSTTVHLYMPRGTRTAVDVRGYMHSSELSPDELRRRYLRTWARAYREDLPYFRRFAREHLARKGPKH